MRISEIFYSLQGEGVYTGMPMTFVRLQGCPFRCRWCDSKYTWENGEGTEMPLEEVLAKVQSLPPQWVCVTGGEPLAHAREFKDLAMALKARGYWITVETAGAYKIPWTYPIDCWVMDIKCPGSGMEQHNKYEEVGKLRGEDQLKFVVADRADFDFSLGVIKEHAPQCHVLFSPVWGELDPQMLADWVKRDAPKTRVSLQAHKYIWGDRRGF